MLPFSPECAIAAQTWKLSDCDLAELSRNSVLQSGYPYEQKAEWIGAHYQTEGPQGNDFTKTKLPNIRLGFRQETLDFEKTLIGFTD